MVVDARTIREYGRDELKRISERLSISEILVRVYGGNMPEELWDEEVYTMTIDNGDVWACYKFRGDDAWEKAEDVARLLSRRGYKVDVEHESRDKSFVYFKLMGDELLWIEEDEGWLE